MEIIENNNYKLKEEKDKYMSFIGQREYTIADNINKFFFAKSELENLKNNLNNFGAKKEEIENSINNQKDELRELILKFNNVSREEIESYNKTIEIINKNHSYKNEVLNSLNSLSHIDFSYFDEYFSKFKNEIKIKTGSDILCNSLDAIYNNGKDIFDKTKNIQKNEFKKR